MKFSLQLTVFYTILRKEIVRVLRIWPQTLLPPVITQTLYFIIFGGFIGSQLKEIEGVSYMAFIVPGLVMMSVINMSFMNVVSSFFSNKFLRNIEEMMVAPVSNYSIVFGFSAGGMFRGLVTGLIVFCISLYFTRPEIYSFWIILLFIFLTSAVFALGGLINGIFAKDWDDINIFPTFILLPLTYFGGVFYSVKDLPPIWQTVSKFNPILYMVDGFRYGFFGFSDLNVQYSLTMLTLLTGFLFALNLYLLKRGTGLKS